MPYIPKQHRPEIEALVDELSAKIEQIHKETGLARGAIVNFTVSELIRSVWKDPRYADMAEACSSLNEASLEYSRRVVGPYEDNKIASEGDIRNFNSGEYNAKNKIEVDLNQSVANKDAHKNY